MLNRQEFRAVTQALLFKLFKRVLDCREGRVEFCADALRSHDDYGRNAACNDRIFNGSRTGFVAKEATQHCHFSTLQGSNTLPGIRMTLEV